MRKKLIFVFFVICMLGFPLAIFAQGQNENSGAASTKTGSTTASGKFRTVPLSWIVKLENKLQSNIMTPHGPNGEKITSPAALKLSSKELKAARKLHLQNYVFMVATPDTTELLNRVGMNEELSQIGAPPIPFVGANSVSQQITELQDMTAKASETSFIVAEAYEADTTGPAFVNLGKAGVPEVHNWTTPRGVNKLKDYVGLMDIDGYGQGVASAEILAYKMHYKGNVGIIYFSLTQWTNVERLKGALDTFAKYPGIKVVAKKGFTDPSQSRSIALGMLQAHPGIDAIWATWMAGPATGAAQAVVQLGLTGKVIIAAPDLGGIAGARYIADPNYPIVGGAAGQEIQMGKDSIRAAVKYLLGEKASGLYVPSHVIPAVRANLVDAFYRQTQGSLGNLPASVLKLLKK